MYLDLVQVINLRFVLVVGLRYGFIHGLALDLNLCVLQRVNANDFKCIC
jgi:hypothetical protein